MDVKKTLRKRKENVCKAQKKCQDSVKHMLKNKENDRILEVSVLVSPYNKAKEEIKMQLDVWSVIVIVITVIGFFGGIWYEHK